MRPVNKNLFTTNQITYTPYGGAKDDLILALGNFCSYCERAGFSSALDVEHINDKSTYPLEKSNWSNFLLACKNCNSIKGTKPIGTSLVPHIDDTFHVFSYLESGYISINTDITTSQGLDTKVQELVDLVGLDRRPGHPDYSTKDKRWKERKNVWDLASEFLTEYENGTSSLNAIIKLSLGYGFWSIWITVFNNHIEVKQKLIDCFKGTKQEYFSF